MIAHTTIGTVLLSSMIWSTLALGQTQASRLTKVDTVAASPTNAHNGADAASLAYLVGESDVLHVNVWKEPEISQTVIVRPDGLISLPLIKEIKVSGLTPLQIQNVVSEKLQAFLNNPQVTVTVTEIRSKKAFITGEVIRPGGYALSNETTVLQLIAQAGGFTTFAKRDNVVILRNENGQLQRLKFKYTEVVNGDKAELNIPLRAGDTVVVP
jgi:polysaccharide biosynthesis/export protein